MLDLSDNGFYLILGLLAFWLPMVGYWLSLNTRAARLSEEEELLREETMNIN
ncbi:MAG: hypothetical protein ACPGWR_18240 [Ardenticatenaceae bacterium]